MFEGLTMSMCVYAIASACGIWYCFILLVQAIGFTQLYATRQPNPNLWSQLTQTQVSILFLSTHRSCVIESKVWRCPSYHYSSTSQRTRATTLRVSSCDIQTGLSTGEIDNLSMYSVCKRSRISDLATPIGRLPWLWCQSISGGGGSQSMRQWRRNYQPRP